ncbi:MAG: alanine racemase [Candidatus Paracaedibacteraceae bacterium]|nr:alanine racemase [Candidatus Paracaedibacteraceae bacterium]
MLQPQRTQIVETTKIPEQLAGLPTSTYSCLIVNLDLVAHNYNHLKSMTATAECSAVLKADGYGMGAIPMALRLMREGCKSFFVAFADEGVALREAFIDRGLDADIYILNGFFPGSEGVYADFHLIPALTDLDQVARWQAFCHMSGRKLPAALHVDTGMTRTGLPSKEYMTLASNPQLLEGMDLKLVLSQMVYSHDENLTFTQQQRQRFEQAIRHMPKMKASLAKSGVVFLGQEYHYDMVRPGIALHGVNPTNAKNNPLIQTMELWGRIYQIQDVAVGQSIGYSQTFVAANARRVATIGVGYADGYPWAMANKGYVFIAGQKCPILGRVSMDVITVDVTDIPESQLEIGGWAQLVGRDIPVDEIAKTAGTVPYEILLRMGDRFRRVYTAQ